MTGKAETWDLKRNGCLLVNQRFFFLQFFIIAGI